MRYKNAPAKLKTHDDTTVSADGTFEAIVSVFDNPDADNDVVRPGAFKDSIEAWKKLGDPIPVWWSHRMDDPSMNVGQVIDIDELEPGDERIPEWADEWVKAHGGLWVKGRIDTGDDASDKAAATRRLLKERRVTQFSYAYDVVDGSMQTHTKDGGKGSYYEIRKVRLYEVSPTPIGANTLTELVGVKHGTKDDTERVLSTENEATLRELHDKLGEVLASLDGTTSAGEDDQAKDEEPARDSEQVKSEEPTRLTAESVRSIGDIYQNILDAA